MAQKSSYSTLRRGNNVWSDNWNCAPSVLCPQGASGNASVLERRGPVTAQGFVQEEPRQQARSAPLSARHRSEGQDYAANLLIFFIFLDFLILNQGSGADGAEEIKRHGFFSTIDWNVCVQNLKISRNVDDL